MDMNWQNQMPNTGTSCLSTSENFLESYYENSALNL